MKFWTSTILTLYIGLMFASLLHTSPLMDTSHTMSGMSDCPFMMHEEVLCSMTLQAHLESWKSLFADLIPTTFTLLTTLSAAALVISIAPHLIHDRVPYSILVHWLQIKHSSYSYTIRPNQELFSSGILNPKLF